MVPAPRAPRGCSTLQPAGIQTTVGPWGYPSLFGPVDLQVACRVLSIESSYRVDHRLNGPIKGTCAFTMQSTTTAIASASSLPLILCSFATRFHVGFTKYFAEFCAHVLKQGGTTGVKELARVGRSSEYLPQVGHLPCTRYGSGPDVGQ